MLVELLQVKILVHGQFNLDAAVPAGIFNGVHQFYHFDAVLAVHEKGLLAQNGGGEVVDDALVLGIFAVGFHVDHRNGRLLVGFLAASESFAAVNLVFVVKKLFVFAKKLSARTGNFQTVGTGRFAGGGDEDARSAVFVYQG